jgi:hypothetical protein
MPIMSPEKIRELKEKRKALQSELKEIDRSGVPERRINDQGKEVTFMPIGFENLRRWSAIKLKLEQLDEQLKPYERRPRKSKPSGSTMTQVATSGPPPAFFTEAMLAERWYCSNSRLQQWRRDGKGPSYVKIEGRILYPYDELVKFEIQRLVKTDE